jgi:hypothetical protein
MNKKILIITLSILALFITACSTDGSSIVFSLSDDELTQECSSTNVQGQIVYDDEGYAYECYTSNGLIWTLYEASEYDDLDLDGIPDAEDECTECEEIAEEITNTLELIASNDGTIMAIRAELLASGWYSGSTPYVSTYDVLMMRTAAISIDSKLSDMETTLLDAATDLAAITGYDDEVVIIEDGILATAMTALGSAQTDTSALLTFIADKELPDRWKPLVTTTVASIKMATVSSGAVPTSDTVAMIYTSGAYGTVLGRLDTAGTFTGGTPSSTLGKLMIVGSIPLTWNGWTAENDILLVNYYDVALGYATDIVVQLPNMEASQIAAGMDDMPLYVAVDGSTFWVEEDGILMTDYPTLSPTFDGDHLAAPSRT